MKRETLMHLFVTKSSISKRAVVINIVLKKHVVGNTKQEKAVLFFIPPLHFVFGEIITNNNIQ